MSKSLTDNLNELNKALEEAVMPMPVLDVVDVYEKAKPYLSPASLEALSKKSISLVVQEAGEEPGTTKSFQSIYLGVTLTDHFLELAIEALAADLNALSALGLIHSAVAPMQYVRLAKMPLSSSTIGLFSFVLVPSEKVLLCKKLCAYFNEEGDMGKPLGSLEPKLHEGEFIAEVRTTLWDGNGTTEERVQRQIDQYLAVLPKGTEVLQVTKCAIVDLSMTYEVKFYNPLMNRYKQVVLDHRREVAIVNNHVEQFNLLTGVTYIEKEQK